MEDIIGSHTSFDGARFTRQKLESMAPFVSETLRFLKIKIHLNMYFAFSLTFDFMWLQNLLVSSKTIFLSMWIYSLNLFSNYDFHVNRYHIFRYYNFRINVLFYRVIVLAREIYWLLFDSKSNINMKISLQYDDFILQYFIIVNTYNC